MIFSVADGRFCKKCKFFALECKFENGFALAKKSGNPHKYVLFI